MIIEPHISSLQEKVPCRYALAIVAAKRARQLVNGSEPMVAVNSDNPVTVALHEIDRGAIALEPASDEEDA